MFRRNAVNILVGLLLIGFYAGSYSTMLKHWAATSTTTESPSGIWNLPPVLISIIAGEFKGLMADYLTLEAGAQMGTKVIRTPEGKFIYVMRTIDWPTINRLYVASQYLDPSFEQTYTVAQGWLPWEGGMVVEMQEILKTSAKGRPWDWQPTHFRGFNTYYFLKLPGEAGKLFLEAAKIPNAPTFLSILGARLAQKGGETRTAIALMKSMLLNKPTTDPDYEEITERLQALEGVAILEKAVGDYKQKFGAYPDTIARLQTSGILPALPNNPYKVEYCIDKSGIIYFDNPTCLKH